MTEGGDDEDAEDDVELLRACVPLRPHLAAARRRAAFARRGARNPHHHRLRRAADSDDDAVRAASAVAAATAAADGDDDVAARPRASHSASSSGSARDGDAAATLQARRLAAAFRDDDDGEADGWAVAALRQRAAAPGGDDREWRRQDALEDECETRCMTVIWPLCDRYRTRSKTSARHDAASRMTVARGAARARSCVPAAVGAVLKSAGDESRAQCGTTRAPPES